MPYAVDYFNQRVLDEVESWPFGILADYVRLVELLIEFGPDVRDAPQRDLEIARRRMKEMRDG